MMAIWIGSFCAKLRYFTDHNGPKEGPQENTKIQKWMLQTVSAEKVDEKKWGHLFIFQVPFLRYGH